MLLGQLKIDCIKKIKTNDQTMVLANIDNLKNDRDYAKYFNNVINSLNDGIRRLVLDEKIPYQSRDIPITTVTNEINKTTLGITNVYRIKSILFEDTDGNIMAIDYTEIGNVYKLGTNYSSGKFIILYAPTVRVLTEDDPETLELTTLGITDLVCGFLTYFVKAELYEKVEPDEATKWRSYAEQYKAALDQEITIPSQKRIREVIKLD